MHTFYSTKPLLFLFFITATFFSVAQSPAVRFRITTTSGTPVSYATVKVVPAEDSNTVLQKVSDSLGRVSFELQAGKQYAVSVTAVGFRPYQKNISIASLPAQFSIPLQAVDKKLSAVVVSASRPLLRQEDDKTIVEPEQLAATSTNAYEMMEKVPGVFMDADGNIYLNSTTPAQVHINGREQRMSTADMATMLKNLPPNAIASIEILRTPSARYDASGGGGIVNVVLRKGVRIGLTGSVSVGGSQGRYGSQFAGLNVNNNNGNLTTYLNLNYSRRGSYDQLTTNRLFSPDSLLKQQAYTRYGASNYFIGYGLNYQLNKKWEVSYDGRFNFTAQDNKSSNLSVIDKISTAQTVFTNNTDVNNKIHNYNLTQGANLKYKIDTLGSEWTTDLSYTYAPNFIDQSFGLGTGDLNNRLHFFSAQTNVLKKLPHKITFETGLKTTGVYFNNSTDYFRLRNGSPEKDAQRSGAYRYSENIHSAYVQASKTFGSFILKAGTRLENTNMSGRQVAPKDTSFSLQRTDFFPYVYLSRSVMKIAGFDLRAYLVYRRTISRPAYEYLNPTLRFVDPFLYETGNPSLRPQFTQNYEVNISVDERPIFALGVNDTKDIFNQVIYTSDTTSKVSVRTYDNLGHNKENYFRVLGAIPPGGKYFFVAGAQYNYNHYQGVYEKAPFEFKRGSWTLFTYHQLKITPLTQFTMNGFIRFKGQQQFYELGTFGQLNVSINQQLLNRKLTLTLSYSDLFFTNNNDFVLKQGSINASGERLSDTRRFGFNLRYNFGLRKREEKKGLFDVETAQ